MPADGDIDDHVVIEDDADDDDDDDEDETEDDAVDDEDDACSSTRYGSWRFHRVTDRGMFESSSMQPSMRMNWTRYS